MKAIYFGDPGDSVEAERNTILIKLANNFIENIEIEAVEIPPFNRHFDILFFDWGGLSMGNSMLEHFCREIIKCSEDNPGRIFIMTSLMTEEAMEDALYEFGDDRPSNIYLKIEDALLAIKAIVDNP